MNATMITHPIGRQSLANLFVRSQAKSHRASSFDRTGANRDYISIGPGETAVLLDQEGAGCVTRLYCAMLLPDVRDYRRAVLRCYWDGAAEPSVEVPLGDFYALAHARVREFQSLLVVINPGCGGTHGLNAYFPMPFSSGARMTLENTGDTVLGGMLGAFWYHVEYETYDERLPEEVGRFHACFRQERPTKAMGLEPNVQLHGAENTDGLENYIALDTQGSGQMVGLVLEINNLQGPIWYGEGDDMVFIDGELWPPSIHGTGTEEIFGGGASPAKEYFGPYSGFHVIESAQFDGLIGMYRWFLHDPIHFSTSLRWTLEHGHANNFANDYASVAYWYQSPRSALPPLPAREELDPPLGDQYAEAWTEVAKLTRAAIGRTDVTSPARFFDICQAADPLYQGDFARALGRLQRLASGSGPG